MVCCFRTSFSFFFKTHQQWQHEPSDNAYLLEYFFICLACSWPMDMPSKHEHLALYHSTCYSCFLLQIHNPHCEQCACVFLDDDGGFRDIRAAMHVQTSKHVWPRKWTQLTIIVCTLCTYVCTYVCVCMCVCTYVPQVVLFDLRIYFVICIFAPRMCRSEWSILWLWQFYVCMYVFLFVCLSLCMCVLMYVCVCVCMLVCLFVCLRTVRICGFAGMYICLYICICSPPMNYIWSWKTRAIKHDILCFVVLLMHIRGIFRLFVLSKESLRLFLKNNSMIP